MGIYDNSVNFGDDRIKYAAIGIVALIIIGALIYGGLGSIQPSEQNPLELKFEKNPAKSTELNKAIVTISNIFENDLTNVPVKISAKERSEFDIYPLNSKFDGTIPILSKGTSREITYVINPAGNVLPGTYVIVAETQIEGKNYRKEAVLTIN